MARPSSPGRAALRAIGAPRLHWARDGADWPHRSTSHFVRTPGLRWHVQRSGRGPVLLLLHGTGGSTHSWRHLMPVLARDFTVLAPDLPGHGFTEAPRPTDLSLPRMAGAVWSLLHTLDAEPALVVGHSAGAAIAARMCVDALIRPDRLVSINGALLPLGGAAQPLFARLARALTWSPWVPGFLAYRGRDPSVIRRMLRGTGSRLGAEDADYYGRLLSNPHHVRAALGMMARWDLRPLVRDLPRLEPRLTLVVGGRDRYIPPRDAERVKALVPSAELVPLPGLGHLAHEEDPEAVAALLTRERPAPDPGPTP